MRRRSVSSNAAQCSSGQSLVGMRAAQREHDPRARQLAIALPRSAASSASRQLEVGLGRGERHVHRRISTRSQSITSSRKWRGSIPALVMNRRCSPSPGPMRSGIAGEHCGKRRAYRAIEDPDTLEFAPRSSADEPREMTAAREFRAVVLEIDHLADARLGLQQFLRVRRGQGQERHARLPASSPRSRG